MPPAPERQSSGETTRSVGASGAVARFLEALDWEPRRPAKFVARIWGFLLLLCVGYTQFIVSETTAVLPVFCWLLSYLLYILTLELARSRLNAHYDKVGFRYLRTILNFVFITWLVAVSSHDRALFALFFVIPIFAAICYFPGKVAPLATVPLTVLGLYLGGMHFAHGEPLDAFQLVTTFVMLLAICFGLKMALDRGQLNSTHLEKVAAALHKAKSLDDRLKVARDEVRNFTGAEQVLIIVVDPDSKRYITHIDSGLELLPNASIEDVLKRCDVLDTGDPFESADAQDESVRGFVHRNAYACDPRSILAHPLETDGSIFGVLTVSHDRPRRFDRLAKRFTSQFAKTLAETVKAALDDRRTQLRHPRGHHINTQLMTAASEGEVLDLLLEGVGRIAPGADRHLHRLDGDRLLPWGPQSFSDAHVDHETALLHAVVNRRDPIRIGKASEHPECSREPQAHAFYRSLMVAPVATGTKAFGTVTVTSLELNAFGLEQELDMASLALQAAAALSRVRESEELREHAEVLRRILDKVRDFDVTRPEEMLCREMAEAARDLLGFDVVRLRLLDGETQDLVTVAMICDDDPPLIGHRVPLVALKPLFVDEHAAGRSYLIPPDSPAWQQVPRDAFHRSPSMSMGQWRVDHAFLTPIIDVSGWVGLLSLDNPVSGNLPNTYLMEAIGVFATYAGWAIQKARAHQRLLAQQREAQVLDESVRAELAACRSLDSLGELVTNDVRQMLHAHRCSLYLNRDGKRVIIHSSAIETESGSFATRSVFIRTVNNTILGELQIEGVSGTSVEPEIEGKLASLVRQIPWAVQTIARFEHITLFERSRLQDDLHDLSGWYHLGIQSHIDTALHWLEEGDARRVKERLDVALRNGKAYLAELRALQAAVTSHYLAIADCYEALDTAIKALRELAGLDPSRRIDLNCPQGLILPGPLHNSLLRIAFGAVANAIRHSGVMTDPNVKIAVTVQPVDELVTLTVSDTGHGAEPIVDGIGIKRMKDHVQQLQRDHRHAAMVIESQLNQGTVVRFSAGLERILQ